MPLVKELKDFFASDDFLIVLGCCKTLNGRHSGILYKDPQDKNVYLFHLAFHNSLILEKVENFKGNFYCVEFTLLNGTNDPDYYRREAIYQFIQTVYEESKTKSISYALKYDKSFFDISGHLKLTPGCIGLTCATFILAFFKGVGYELLNSSDWEPRSEDDAWHSEIIDLMESFRERFSIDITHIENVKKEKGCVRFRPEEVVAASHFFPLPANINECQALGKEILLQLT